MTTSHIMCLNEDKLHNMVSQTDWPRINAMTDAEITAAAASDPDALPLDDAFFATPHRLSAIHLANNSKHGLPRRDDLRNNKQKHTVVIVSGATHRLTNHAF